MPQPGAVAKPTMELMLITWPERWRRSTGSTAR